MSLMAAVINKSVDSPAIANGMLRNVSANPIGDLFMADWRHHLALAGKVWYAGDGDANDRVTGQTSFADTTPTFLLTVPAGTTCIPLGMYLGQAGTVAGAAIDVNMAISSTSIAYASGGTSEAVANARSDISSGNACALWSGATATTALLTKQLRSWTLGQDVSPAEGAVQEVIWTPDKQGFPIYLVGPAALGVFAYAGTTGPTLYWHFAWAELPSTFVTA